MAKHDKGGDDLLPCQLRNEYACYQEAENFLKYDTAGQGGVLESWRSTKIGNDISTVCLKGLSRGLKRFYGKNP